MDRDALQELFRDEPIRLVLAQADALASLAEQIASLTERTSGLEAELGLPPETPDDSSVPPSRGQETDRAERRASKPEGRPGTFRASSDTPGWTVTATVAACPHCDHALSPQDRPGVHADDPGDLPPIRPVVTRVHRHRGTCPCCPAPSAHRRPAVPSGPAPWRSWCIRTSPGRSASSACPG